MLKALSCILVGISAVGAFVSPVKSNLRLSPIGKISHMRSTELQMAVYSSEDGIPAALVEERDACGVGFIANLNNKATHSTMTQAIQALTCMEHRGATSADNLSGDGSGIMSAIPWKLFSDYCDPEKVKNKDGTTGCAVGMLFLPREEPQTSEHIKIVEDVLNRSGFTVLGFRDVPVDKGVLGELSLQFVPVLKQVIVRGGREGEDSGFETDEELESELYAARREIHGLFRKEDFDFTNAYVTSLSSRTLIYKGMLRSADLALFYKDLTDERFETNFAVYHRRFSTNTVPKWYLAQPMRLIAHNGEINTLLGNINWMKSRERAMLGVQKKTIGSMLRLQGPLVDVTRSDSANLDSVLESLVRGGRTPEEAIMMLVPEAYMSQPRMSSEVRDFYRYYEALQEAWDGPALLVFSNGKTIGAALDRNGLRPARYMVTANEEGDKTVHMMSEVGVTKALSLFAENEDDQLKTVLLDSGRLGPGEMLAVDLKEGVFRTNNEVKSKMAQRHPYGSWADTCTVPLPVSPFQSEITSFVKQYSSLSLSPNLEGVVKESGETSESESEEEREKEKKETAPLVETTDASQLLEMQTVFGWGSEDVEQQISAMAITGIESTFCMGDDAPLAALSVLSHTLYDYFKQRFAQVTNPPIDPLREGAVMSLRMFLGPRGDPLCTKGQLSKRVAINSPMMNLDELHSLKKQSGVNVKTVSTLYPLYDALSVGGLAAQIESVCSQAISAVREGSTIINLSDKDESGKGYSDQAFVPPLLAVAAVHHRLIKEGLRNSASIIITTGQAWSTHHLACLVGFGASAVVPYAAYDAVLNWHATKRTQNSIQRGDIPELTPAAALNNYRKAMDKGLLKVLSKMGISLLSSYHGSQIFEALGLSDDVMTNFFPGTPCRVTGLDLDDLAAEGADFHRRAYGEELFYDVIKKVERKTTVIETETKKETEKEGEKEGETEGEPTRITKLFNYGFLNYFKSGDYHHNNQPLFKTLATSLKNKDIDLFHAYEQEVQNRPPTTLRDTLEFIPASVRGRESIDISEVESVEDIMTRFNTGAMSLGALSREAHETLAIAMNRIGGKSNCGEGGEDTVRNSVLKDVDDEGKSGTFPHLKGLQNGDSARSKIKQVASGRFGVTPAYLMSGDQLEIKIAQGAKPGEGGQLPGKKIDTYIAGLRNSKPGVTLISPPPHHDIYSIEDLAQLIHDLHQINPKAPVSVKLVSEVGIGTVASGVAKAGADVIQVSGHDGGTGASPTSSIKHAGSPWELGLAEAHSALRKNGLRNRVLLRVDGGLKSGWDVVMAAAMGAEEYGFGTIAMVAEGCIMARICHTNKCPVGVTTQNEKLRARFPGVPGDVVTFFGYVAEEVRSILATLGYKSLDEIIGKPGVLRPRTGLSVKKTSNGLDSTYITDSLFCLMDPTENFCAPDTDRSWLNHPPVVSNGMTLDDTLLSDEDILTAINTESEVTKNIRIMNTNRSALARVSGVIAAKYGDKKFKGSLNFNMRGAAGQSFCAFLGQGMHVTLTGYANDYVGKGMAGGSITVSPPSSDDASSTEGKELQGASKYSVVGNTCLYGATGGEFHARGRAGERFAVRNSGAVGVVEGLGDHGCEYMTAGIVVCLGSIGRNFGAGMTGGLAFVLDDKDWLSESSSSSSLSPIEFDQLINGETVTLQHLSANNKAAKDFLITSLERHISLTGSAKAKSVLSKIEELLAKIWVVVPAAEKTNPLLAETPVDVDVDAKTLA